MHPPKQKSINSSQIYPRKYCLTNMFEQSKRHNGYEGYHVFPQSIETIMITKSRFR